VDDVVDIVTTETREPPGPIVSEEDVSVAVSPTEPAGIVALRLIVPLKPRLLIVTVEVADPPAVKLAGDGAVCVITQSGVTT